MRISRYAAHSLSLFPQSDEKIKISCRKSKSLTASADDCNSPSPSKLFRWGNFESKRIKNSEDFDFKKFMKKTIISLAQIVRNVVRGRQNTFYNQFRGKCRTCDADWSIFSRFWWKRNGKVRFQTLFTNEIIHKWISRWETKRWQQRM